MAPTPTHFWRKTAKTPHIAAVAEQSKSAKSRDEMGPDWRFPDTVCPNSGQVRSIGCKLVITKLIGRTESHFPVRGYMVNFPRQQEDFVTLSERERQVLQCVANGLSSKECAQELGIAPRTVERHVENLRNKLNARNKSHLVAKALSAGHI
jgi:DNA-binding CsgD family transcriptional regulator